MPENFIVYYSYMFTFVSYSEKLSKEELKQNIRAFVASYGFEIDEEDWDRPWGGFFKISENQIVSFIEKFFSGINASELTKNNVKLSPKILVVLPGELLSWQYHDRRGELWSLLYGEAGVKLSKSNDEPEVVQPLEPGKLLVIPQGTRHRLVGGIANYGVIAEIWQHTDFDHPSDEADNHRLKDKYARS